MKNFDDTIFRQLMWPSSGWHEQEYNPDYNVSE